MNDSYENSTLTTDLNSNITTTELYPHENLKHGEHESAATVIFFIFCASAVGGKTYIMLS